MATALTQTRIGGPVQTPLGVRPSNARVRFTLRGHDVEGESVVVPVVIEVPLDDEGDFETDIWCSTEGTRSLPYKVDVVWFDEVLGVVRVYHLGWASVALGEGVQALADLLVDTVPDGVPTDILAAAAAYASAASTAGERARSWAVGDTPPDPSDPDSKSSKSWALEAAATAERIDLGALDDAVEATAEDRAQTNLDKIATAADRVQTGLDVIAAALEADRAEAARDAAASVSLVNLGWVDTADDLDDLSPVTGDRAMTLDDEHVHEFDGADWVDQGVSPTALKANLSNFTETQTYYRSDVSMAGTNLGGSNTFILGTPIEKSGTIKHIRLRNSGGSATSLKIRVFRRVSGDGMEPLTSGQEYVQVGSDYPLSIGTGSVQDFDVSIPVQRGDRVGWYSSVSAAIVYSTTGDLDTWFAPSIAGDYDELEIGTVDSTRRWYFGFDVEALVVTADTFADLEERTAELESSKTFYAPASSLPEPTAGRLGVMAGVGPVWADGYVWYQVRDNEPIPEPWARIMALAVQDGWAIVYDINNPFCVTLREDDGDFYVSDIRDAMGNVSPLQQATAASQPRLNATAFGDLAGMTFGEGGATKLLASWPDSPQPRLVMTVATPDESVGVGNRFVFDGLGTPYRQAALLAGTKGSLFSGNQYDLVSSVAVGEPAVWSCQFDTTTSLWINGSGGSVADSSGSLVKGITLGDRYSNNGSQWLGDIGPVLIHNSPTAPIRIRMENLLAELAGIAFPDLEIGASYGVGIYADTGEVYFAKEGNEVTPYASVTKCLNALTVHKWVTDYSTTVTVQSGDIVGGSTAQLETGDVLTLSDLMYGMALPSGNDAATALARHVGGIIRAAEGSSGDNVTRFVSEMQVVANELGLTGIVAGSNAYGLMQCSTLDAARLMRAMSVVEVLSDFFAPVSHEMTITGANARTYTVYHTLAGDTRWGDNWICGKTGSGTDSVSTYNTCAIAFDYYGRRVIVAVKARLTEPRNASARAILDYAHDV